MELRSSFTADGDQDLQHRSAMIDHHLRWRGIWAKSPRYNRTQRLDPDIINRSFVKLTASFPKRLTGLLMCLRSQHAPLNSHLHRINRADDPHCPHCPDREETVHHFLAECPHTNVKDISSNAPWDGTHPPSRIFSQTQEQSLI